MQALRLVLLCFTAFQLLALWLRFCLRQLQCHAHRFAYSSVNVIDVTIVF